MTPRTFKKDQPVRIKVQTLVSTESQLQFDYYQVPSSLLRRALSHRPALPRGTPPGRSGPSIAARSALIARRREQLPFCKPPKIVDLPENLGEALAGEKAHTSAFKIRMRKNEYCKTLCRQTYTPAQMEEFQDFAILDYRVNMRLDNLPVAEITKFYYDDRPDQTLQTYNLGVPLGAKLHEEVHADEAVAEHYVLNNHLRFKILYHKASTDADASAWDGDAQMGMYDYETMGAMQPHHYMRGNLIVGFTAAPYSIAHTFDGEWNKTCAPYCKLTTCLPGPEGGFGQHKPQRIDTAQGGTVIWTYDVVWEESAVKWASRWDVYLQMTDDKIHWFSIINSFVILLFLTAIVVMIFSRILRNDLSQYNVQDEEMDAAALREETGWKLLHGDVFRFPPAGMLLSVFVATGWQLLSMAASVLLLAALGFLSPAHRGSLLEAVLLLYLLSGIAAGLVAARLAKLFAHEDRLRLTMLTALVFPAICTGIFLIINTVIWAHHSSMAVPFGTFIVVALLWFVVSLPLVFLGAYLGFRQDVLALPCRTNQIPREIPPQQWSCLLPLLALLCLNLPLLPCRVHAALVDAPALSNTHRHKDANTLTHARTQLQLLRYQTLVPSMFVGGLLPFGAVFVVGKCDSKSLLASMPALCFWPLAYTIAY